MSDIWRFVAGQVHVKEVFAGGGTGDLLVSSKSRTSFCPHVSSSAACLQTIFTSAFPFTLTCLDEYCVCNEQQVTLQIRLRGKSKLERLSSQSRRTLASHVVPRSTGDPRSLHSVSLPNSSGQICTTAPDPAGWIHPQRMAMMQSAVPPCHPYDRNQLFGSAHDSSTFRRVRQFLLRRTNLDPLPPQWPLRSRPSDNIDFSVGLSPPGDVLRLVSFCRWLLPIRLSVEKPKTVLEA